jgi:putative tryptophan/tyrosine transport system substrate-binding protein
VASLLVPSRCVATGGAASRPRLACSGAGVTVQRELVLRFGVSVADAAGGARDSEVVTGVASLALDEVLMRRRDLLAAASAIAIVVQCTDACAQVTRRGRLGWLSGAGKQTDDNSPLAMLRAALSGLDWKPGELEIEEREGDASNLPALAAEIVALRPDVIACTGGAEAKALQGATHEIPVVFIELAVDPVSAGLVESISQPGGNLTGFLQMPELLTGKRLDILAELLGRHPRRVAYVLNPENVNAARLEADAAQAAGHIGADLQRRLVIAPKDLEPAFDGMHYFHAAMVQHDLMFLGLRKEFADLARRRRIPVMYENRGHVEAGGLISYGADPREGHRQGAVYIDRILKGAHLRDLPVLQASRFELVLNATTARALNLTISPSLLARADAVIE